MLTLEQIYNYSAFQKALQTLPSDIQVVAHNMVDIINDPTSTYDERQRAAFTFMDIWHPRDYPVGWDDTYIASWLNKTKLTKSERQQPWLNQWLSVLEGKSSVNIPQTRFKLYNSEGMSCLGVLCWVLRVKAVGMAFEDTSIGVSDEIVKYCNLRDKFGSIPGSKSLTILNSKLSFRELANIIRQGGCFANLEV